MQKRKRVSPLILKSAAPLLIIFFVVIGGCSMTDKYTVSDKDGNTYRVKKMTDGKFWTTENVRVDMPGSYCYDSLKSNCDHYGRLYTWESATKVCSQLAEGWRLPTNDDWQKLAKLYGGVWDDSDDEGNAAYKSLIDRGPSEFNALLSGGKDPDGSYKRLNAHGFYWTSTETSSTTAWLYNFGSGRKSLNRHSDAEKVRAIAVRCIK